MEGEREAGGGTLIADRAPQGKWGTPMGYGAPPWDMGHPHGIWGTTMGYGAPRWDMGHHHGMWGTTMRYGAPP